MADKYIQPFRLVRGTEKFHQVGDYNWLLLRPNKDAKTGKMLTDDCNLRSLDFVTGFCENGEHWILTVTDNEKISNAWQNNYARANFPKKEGEKFVDDKEKLESFNLKFKESQFLTAMEVSGIIPLEIAAKVLHEKKVLFKFDAALFPLKDFEGWTDEKKKELQDAFSSYIDEYVSEGDVAESFKGLTLLEATFMTGIIAFGLRDTGNKFPLPIEGFPKIPGKGDPFWEKIHFSIPGKEEESKSYYNRSSNQNEIDKLNERLQFVKERASEFREVLLQYGIQPTNHNLLPFALSFVSGAPFSPVTTGEPVTIINNSLKDIEKIATKTELPAYQDLTEYFDKDKLDNWFRSLVAKASVDVNIKVIDVLNNLRRVVNSNVFSLELKTLQSWIKKYLKVESGNILDVQFDDIAIIAIAVEKTDEEVKKNPSYSVMMVTDLVGKF